MAILLLRAKQPYGVLHKHLAHFQRAVTKQPGEPGERVPTQACDGELVPEVDDPGRIRSGHRDHQPGRSPKRESSTGNQFLQWARQVSSKLEPSRHPALAAPDRSRNLLGGAALLFNQLSHQPALFEGREPRSQMTRPDLDERFGR